MGNSSLSQYLQVIHRADPPHPSFLPSLGFGRFSRGWVGRRGSPSQTLPSLPPSSQTTGLGPQRSLPSALARSGSRLRAGATIRWEGAALLLIPPSKVGFKLGGLGPCTGLPREEGFWARVCKAIFLCGRKGRWGMNTGCGERVRNGREGRRKGPPSGAQSPEPLRPSHTHIHKIPSVPAPSASSLAPTPPPKTPKGGLRGAHSCRTIHSGPTPPALPCLFSPPRSGE